MLTDADERYSRVDRKKMHLVLPDQCGDTFIIYRNLVNGDRKTKTVEWPAVVVTALFQLLHLLAGRILQRISQV